VLGFIGRKFITGLVIVVALLVIAAVAGLSLLDNIVKAGVEKGGPVITRVPLGVDDVDISLLGGSFALSGFRMGNPEGYDAPDSVRVGRVQVDAKLGSLMSDEIVLPLIEVDRPEIIVEFSGGKTNLAAILENVRKPPPSDQEPSGKRLRIDKMRINAPAVEVALPAGQTVKTTLPDIALDNLAAGGESRKPAEVVEDILTALQQRVLEEIEGRIPAQQLQQLTREGEEAVQTGRDALEEGRKALEDLGGVFNRPRPEEE
jgi:hypothetical protein